MPVFVRGYERECEAKDVDFRTLWLVEKIQKMFDKHCPLKTKIVSYKSYAKPWLSKELIDAVNYKHLLFKKFKLGIIPFPTYRSYNNKISKLVKKLDHSITTEN